MVLALYNSSVYRLSMYQVLFNALLYSLRYALDKMNAAKIRKGSNSVNTGPCIQQFPSWPSISASSFFNYLQYFQRYALDKLIIAKNRKGNNSVTTCDGLLFLHSAISLIDLYQCIKFH